MSKGFILQSALVLILIAFIGLWSYSKIEDQIKVSVQEGLNISLNITEQALISWFKENKYTAIALANSSNWSPINPELSKVVV